MADNLAIARKLYDGWNERKFDELADMMAPDGKLVVASTGEEFVGKEGSHRYNEDWADGFPDGRVTVDRMIDAGDTVIVEITGRGTHTGTLRSSMGDIPATGRSLTLKLCDVLQFENGKVKEQHTYFDTGSMMAQLGLIEMPAASQRK